METPRTETPQTEIPRTKSIITIVVLLVLLAALSVTSALTTGQFGGFNRTRPQGSFNGTPVPGRNFQDGGGNFQGGGAGGDAQGGNFQGRNGGGGGGNFQGGGGAGGNFRGGGGGFGGFNMFGVTRQLGINPMVMIYVSLGATILGILLALLCAFGVWKQKKWALNLAMVLALLFLVAALPGLFAGGRFNLLRTAMQVVNVGASAAILVLGILPSVRETVS